MPRGGYRGGGRPLGSKDKRPRKPGKPLDKATAAQVEGVLGRTGARVSEMRAAQDLIPPSFDVLEQLELVARTCLGMAANAQRARGKDEQGNDLPINEKHEKQMGVWIDRATRVLGEIAPYRHPRLAAVAVRNLTPMADLSEMTDEQLGALAQFLEVIFGGRPALAGGGAGGDVPPGAGPATSH